MQTTMGSFNPQMIWGNANQLRVDATPGFLGLGRRPGGTRVGNFLRRIFGDEQGGFQGVPRPPAVPPGGGGKNPMPALINEVGNVVREHARTFVNNVLTPQSQHPYVIDRERRERLQQTQQQMLQRDQALRESKSPQPTNMLASLPIIGIIALLVLLVSGIGRSARSARSARRSRRVRSATRAPRGVSPAPRAPRAKPTDGFARRIHGKLYRSPEAWGKAMKALRKK